MTIWWAFALALSAIQLLTARWRDIGSAVLTGYGSAIFLTQPPLGATHWAWILVGLFALVLSWWRGSARGVWRPRLNGLALSVVGVGFAIQPLINLWASPLPTETLRLGIASSCGLASMIFLILALERPRPRPLRYSGRRTITVTTGEQAKNQSVS